MTPHRVLVLALLPSCIYGQGMIGTRTPVSGELDKGSQVRFAGSLAEGFGMNFEGGGAAGGVLIEHIPPGNHHTGIGVWGLAELAVHRRVHAFARVSNSWAITSSDNKCTSKNCARSFGIAIGANLVKVSPPGEQDGEVEDAPRIFGTGLALTYNRAILEGDTVTRIGHYVGIQLTFMFSGALTHSKH